MKLQDYDDGMSKTLEQNKSTDKKPTRSERLQQVYDDVLGEIIKELKELHNEDFNIGGRVIYAGEDNIAAIFGNGLQITDEKYFEHNRNDWIEIDEVKVRKAFDVAEELCKIELPSVLELKNKQNGVELYFKEKCIGTILDKRGRFIHYQNSYSKEERDCREKKFGNKLKPEQEKEFVQWVADTLGGEYDE